MKNDYKKISLDFLINSNNNLNDNTTHLILECVKQIINNYFSNQTHYLSWQKNNHHDVIGIFPRWLVYVQNCAVINQYRHLQHENSNHQFIPIYKTEQASDVDLSQTSRQDKLKSTHQIVSEQLLTLIQGYQDKQVSPYHSNSPNKNNLLDAVEYHDGLMGYVSYDFSAQLTAKKVNYQTTESKSVFFAHYDVFLQKENGEWYLKHRLNEDATRIATTLLQYLQSTITKTAIDVSKKFDNNKHFQLLNFSATQNKEAYLNNFAKITNYLKAGDCYQVNYAQNFIGTYQGDAFDLLFELDNKTKAPYAGYLDLGTSQIISCSPELFISFQHNHSDSISMLTKPIKGTLPRLNDVDKDNLQIQTLKNSEKNKAENLMIVDLLRNDLSVFAKTGSVKVPKLFDIESYPQVHHMVSSVTAELSKKTNGFQVVLNAMPGGSITGAPKVRALEIIQELEKENRGAYCGSMGFLNFDGTGSFNILIRTLEFAKNTFNLWAGGGITIASDGDDEYQECLDKISGILEVLNQYK